MRCTYTPLESPSPDGNFRCACTRCSNVTAPQKNPCEKRHRKCDVQKSVGLGDTIAKVLSKVGIKKRKGCNCGKRQAKLNKRFPYRRK